MLTSLWHWLGKRGPISSRGKTLRKRLPSSFRPKLEALEDRTLPAPLVPAILPAASEGTTSAVSATPVAKSVATGPSTALGSLTAVSATPVAKSVATGPSTALGSLPSTGSESSSPAAPQTTMTVVENSPNSIIDLGPIFAETSGINPEDGLQMSLLGNTNPGLVTAELSEGVLTLSYTPSMSGTATITVGATEADGTCVRENILVTVIPLLSSTGQVSSSLATAQQMSMRPSISEAA